MSWKAKLSPSVHFPKFVRPWPAALLHELRKVEGAGKLMIFVQLSDPAHDVATASKATNLNVTLRIILPRQFTTGDVAFWGRG